MTRKILALLILSACDPAVAEPTWRAGCPDDSTTGPSDPTADPEPPSGIPTPTAPCPAIVDGDVEFCPGPLLACRTVRVVNASGATSDGPLSLHWHGTFQSPESDLASDSAAVAIAAMVVAEHGLMVLPRADPAAVARASNPFPWWVVCGPDGTSCSRPDDFILADEVAACVLEQGLASPDRLTTSGMSSGGIMATHLADRVGWIAGLISWSGGLPPEYQPATIGGTTAVMALHGGAGDRYCGVWAPPGCTDFREQAEALALDAATAGRFAFVCDHQAGHSSAMGAQGAAFLGAADRAGHPWAGYPFGAPGSGPDWMLNHYCYAAGGVSPW